MAERNITNLYTRDELVEQNERLRTELADAKGEAKLWKMRTDEAAKGVERMEELKAELATAEDLLNLSHRNYKQLQAELVELKEATTGRPPELAKKILDHKNKEIARLKEELAAKSIIIPANPNICQVCGFNKRSGLEHSCM